MANILEIIIRATDAATAPINGVVANLNKASGAFTQVGAVASAAGAAITGSLMAATFAAKNYGEAVDKIVKTTGVSAEAVQGLGFAAEQEHASLEALGGGLRRLSRTMEAAARGSLEARRPFEALGVG